MRKSTIGFLACALLSSSAIALNIPKANKFDPRMVYATYNAGDVFLIKAKNGFVTMVEFSKDERIINIATGFSDGWELIDRENRLFIKPKAYVAQASEQEQLFDEDGNQINPQQSLVVQPNSKDWKTNAIITTNKRIYVFDLALQVKHESNYKVEFSYPDDLAAAKNASEQQSIELENKKELQKELDKTTVPRNWAFVMHVNKGSDDIAPNFAYDDGVFTYLGFDSTKTMPSAFLFQKSNGESILNTHIKKDGKYDVLVIHKTARQILLRSGDKLVGIFNKGYAKNPLDETRQTSSKKVVREIVSDE